MPRCPVLSELCLQLSFFSLPLISLFAVKSQALTEVRDVIHITSTKITNYSSQLDSKAALSSLLLLLRDPEASRGKLFSWERFFFQAIAEGAELEKDRLESLNLIW